MVHHSRHLRVIVTSNAWDPRATPQLPPKASA